MRRLIQLSENRNLIAGYSLAPVKSRDWIVYLPQSRAHFQRGSRRELKSLIGSAQAARFNFLVVNHPGAGPGKTDALAFERSFRRHYRVSDALATLKEIIPKHDKICLVGYSEGAYLAPEIAGADARVIAVAMIGGGTRGWLKEELGNAANAREKAAIRKQIAKIGKRANSAEKWNDFSFATWHSYREDRTLQALKKMRQPALAILGARDKTIDLKSTLSDLNKLAAKKPIHVEVFPGCGHGFGGHWQPVAQFLADFLRAPY